jgi:hypothetical protein
MISKIGLDRLIPERDEGSSFATLLRSRRCHDG